MMVIPGQMIDSHHKLETTDQPCQHDEVQGCLFKKKKKNKPKTKQNCRMTVALWIEHGKEKAILSILLKFSIGIVVCQRYPAGKICVFFCKQIFASPASHMRNVLLSLTKWPHFPKHVLIVKLFLEVRNVWQRHYKINKKYPQTWKKVSQCLDEAKSSKRDPNSVQNK